MAQHGLIPDENGSQDENENDDQNVDSTWNPSLLESLSKQETDEIFEKL